MSLQYKDRYNIFRKLKFSLCLEGANSETYCFLESMYYGSIPVVVKTDRMNDVLKMYNYYNSDKIPIII